MGAVAHNIIVPALVHDKPVLYTIDFVSSPDRTNYSFGCTRHVTGRLLPAEPKTPRLAIAGSGAQYLVRRTKWWMRDLLRILTAYDREQLSATAVADHFAALNYEVHRNLESQTVGPRCIVAWRNGKDGPGRGGGGQHYYTNTTREPSSPSLPTIANGMDVRALAETMMPQFIRNAEAVAAGQPPTELNKDQINAELARLPDKPDENLR